MPNTKSRRKLKYFFYFLSPIIVFIEDNTVLKILESKNESWLNNLIYKHSQFLLKKPQNV